MGFWQKSNKGFNMFGISHESYLNLREIFAQYDSISAVIIYGSRAKGNYRTGSDIDLTLKGDGLDSTLINHIKDKIEALYLPYMFDISIFSTLDNAAFIANINRHGKIFYQKPASTPAYWQEKALGEVCEVFEDGDWIEKKDQAEKGIRLIQTGNIKTGYFTNNLSKARYINDKTFQNLNCKEIYAGDILVSRLPSPVGRSCIIPQMSERMITAVDCTIIRLKNEICSPFLNYYMQCFQYFFDVKQKTTGTTRERIPRKDLSKLSIPIPPLDEQKQIVSILDNAFEAIDTALAHTKKNLSNARELFQTTLNTIFTEKGNDWQEKRLGDVIRLEYGKGLDKNLRNSNGLYPVYGANGKKDRSNLFNYDKKTIIVGRKGSAGEINLTEEKFWALDVTYFVKFDKVKYDLMFLYYFLLEQKITRLAKGVKPGINRNDVYSLKANFPRLLSEQRSIVEKLDALQAQTKQLEALYQQKIEALHILKQSLLQQAFSGALTKEFYDG